MLGHRGVKRAHSFTVDGPFRLAPDVPDKISDVLPEASTMFQVLVEMTVDTEIPPGFALPRILPRLAAGVAVDDQTDEVWPQPRTSTPTISKAHIFRDVVDFAWYCPPDEMPMDLQHAQRFHRHMSMSNSGCPSGKSKKPRNETPGPTFHLPAVSDGPGAILDGGLHTCI